MANNLMINAAQDITGGPEGPHKVTRPWYLFFQEVANILTTIVINLGTQVTGVLGVTNGGTGDASLQANAVLIGNGTNPVLFAAPGASGTVLTSTGVASDPTFQALPAGGDVVGPGSATDNALVRFDGTTGKLIQNGTITEDDTGALTFPDDVRQTFNPGATNAGINVGALAGDPGSPVNGDLWYDSGSNELTARINGSNVSLGISGSGTVTNTGTLTANALIIGNGGVDVTALGTLGTTTTVLHGNAAGAPSFSAVDLAADVTGDLPYANLTPAGSPSILLGRGDSGAGDWQEITLGTNLSITGTTLDAAGGSGGTVTTTGSPASGNLTKFSGATSITNGDLSGDVTTSGTLVTTLKTAAKTRTIGFGFDGGGSTVTTGNHHNAAYIPYACTVTEWTIYGDATTSSCQVDVYSSTYAGFPPTASIWGGTPPSISGAKTGQSTGLSVAIAAGTFLLPNVDSNTAFTWIGLTLTVTV